MCPILVERPDIDQSPKFGVEFVERLMKSTWWYYKQIWFETPFNSVDFSTFIGKVGDSLLEEERKCQASDKSLTSSAFTCQQTASERRRQQIDNMIRV